jgi:hypothetical protein
MGDTQAEVAPILLIIRSSTSSSDILHHSAMVGHHLHLIWGQDQLSMELDPTTGLVHILTIVVPLRRLVPHMDHHRLVIQGVCRHTIVDKDLLLLRTLVGTVIIEVQIQKAEYLPNQKTMVDRMSLHCTIPLVHLPLIIMDHHHHTVILLGKEALRRRIHHHRVLCMHHKELGQVLHLLVGITGVICMDQILTECHIIDSSHHHPPMTMAQVVPQVVVRKKRDEGVINVEE